MMEDSRQWTTVDDRRQRITDDSTLAILGITLGTRGRREREWYHWLSVQDVACRNRREVGRKRLYT